MDHGGFDQEILQDFLTECGELLDALEGDLVDLESSPSDPELLNQVFRALHTIKGSASFLAMTHLVGVTHAAETALNAARGGRLTVDQRVMDLLLQAVDLVKIHFDEIRGGRPLTEPDAALVAELTALGEGGAPASEGDAPPAISAQTQPHAGPLGASVSALALDSGKADLLEFLVADAEESIAALAERVPGLTDDAARAAAASEISEQLDALRRTVDFFEFAPMVRLVDALAAAAGAAEEADAAHANAIAPLFAAGVRLMQEQVGGLAQNELYEWPIDALVVRLTSEDPEQDAFPIDADPIDVLGALGVVGGAATPTEAGVEPATNDTEATPTTASAPDAPANAAGTPDASGGNGGGARGTATVEQTIRVEVGRLESLMNLVGELVLQKNRVSAVTRQVAAARGVGQELREVITQAASDLDRVTGDIQRAVMRTRMQPLDKLFGKYPRLIRDLAQKTGKQIELVIEGGDTEVDKSVLEELGDPLVHIMRNSADHGLEPPAERAEAGKGPTGRITLSASNEGGSVSVRITDNGRGLARERIGRKAIERGLTTENELAQLSDRDVYRFIFHAGFSTADAVSDLSGRGVGMDVVRTNIERLKGTVDVDSVPGEGTTITILIPLTVAILPAMMVRVAEEIYAIPLGSILEIVRPRPEALASIQERPVMRLREDVLPLLDACEVFDVPVEDRAPTPFAVVLSLNEKRVGLMVSGLIGQQEIVIKPLDTATGEPASGPFGGTTVRDDGGVSLIVDVAELMRQAESRTTDAGHAPRGEANHSAGRALAA